MSKERISYEELEGKMIVCVDFSNAVENDLPLLLPELRALTNKLAKTHAGCLYLISIINGAQANLNTMKMLNANGKQIRHLFQKQLVVNNDNMLQVMANIYKQLSGAKFELCKNIETAKSKILSHHLEQSADAATLRVHDY